MPRDQAAAYELTSQNLDGALDQLARRLRRAECEDNCARSSRGDKRTCFASREDDGDCVPGHDAGRAFLVTILSKVLLSGIFTMPFCCHMEMEQNQ